MNLLFKENVSICNDVRFYTLDSWQGEIEIFFITQGIFEEFCGCFENICYGSLKCLASLHAESFSVFNRFEIIGSVNCDSNEIFISASDLLVANSISYSMNRV